MCLVRKIYIAESGIKDGFLNSRDSLALFVRVRVRVSIRFFCYMYVQQLGLGLGLGLWLSFFEECMFECMC